MTSLRSPGMATRQSSSFWVITLVFLHLFAAPCATAMVLMPANMDCEHCQAIDAPDACAVASATTSSVIEHVAFHSGPFDPPALLLPRALPDALPEAVTSGRWLRSLAPRHTGDPPLYLMFGQLRI